MVLYNSLNSIEEIRKALEAGDHRRVIIQTSHFWQQAISENREDVKQFLVEIAAKFPEARSSSLGWLANFPDPALALIFLKYIRDEKGDTAAIYALMEFGQKKVLEPDDPRVVAPLVGLLLLDKKGTNEPVLSALLALKAASAIDVIASYLEHPHPAIRVEAFKCAVVFSKIAHREDILEKAVVFLNDPRPATRLTAAMLLKQEYPERFSDLDLNKYMEDMPFGRKNK